MSNVNQLTNKTAREFTRERNEADTLRKIDELTEELALQGYSIVYGNIGKKTTYCLLFKGDEEIVGYTFVKDLKYLNVNVGKLKALQQAITRKELLEQKSLAETEESK